MNKYLIIIVIIAVIIIIGFAAFYYYSNPEEQTQKELGVIEGSLGYPSERVPEDIEICATNIQTKENYCTMEHLENEKYFYGVGYKIEVPEGIYDVMASKSELEDFKALRENIEVQAGKTVSNVDMTNWERFGAKEDLIMVTSPTFGQTISSPLTVKGRARGNWYFEANFPVVLTDWDGRIIAEAIAQAQGDWMTEDFVDFEAVLEFEAPELIPGTGNTGFLILQKANPSGLPENDNALEIPIKFEQNSEEGISSLKVIPSEKEDNKIVYEPGAEAVAFSYNSGVKINEKVYF